MRFGFLGTYQVSKNWIGNGFGAYTPGVINTPYAWHLAHRPNNCLMTMEWTDDNTSNLSEIDAKSSNFVSTSVATLTAKLDGRLRINDTVTVSNVAASQTIFYNGSFTGNHTNWTFGGGFAGSSRPFKHKMIYHQPYLIKTIASGSVSGGAGDGNLFDGIQYGTFPYPVPYLINCKNIYLRFGGNGQNLGHYTTSIAGTWPPALDYLWLIAGEVIPTSIQHKFPAKLKHLSLGMNSTAIRNDVARLISDCTELETILFRNEVMDENTSESANSLTPISGVLDITHIKNWKTLGIYSTALTSVSYSLDNPNIQRLQLVGCTGITASNLQAMMALFLASNAGIYMNIRSLAKTFTQAITNTDVASTVTSIYTYGNTITGNIVLTTARPNFSIFKTGLNTQNLTTTKNTHDVVDISGLTNAVTLDLSNCNTATLTLPVNTVCTALSLGGNKLDVTVNTLLVSQLQAMTGMVTLFLSTGAYTTADTVDTASLGQDSTNGFGNNLNLTSLTAMTSLYARSCKLTGSLGIPTALVTLFVPNNNLSGISGTSIFTALVNFMVCRNTSFNFDFTRLRTVKNINVTSSSVTTMDLSQLTSTTAWSSDLIRASLCTLLTSVTFPASASLITLPAGQTTITFDGCTALTSMSNMQNITHTNLTFNSSRFFIVSNCSLNQQFFIGTNNFLPTSISLQNNGMSQANGDANIDSIYQNRSKWLTTPVAKSINIAGTNAAISGTYQAPADFKRVVITAVTKTNPCVVTVSSISTLLNDDVVLIRQVGGMTQLNNNSYMVKNISGNTFELYDSTGTATIDSTLYTTYTSGGIAFMDGEPVSIKEQTYVLVQNYGWTITQN